MKSKIWAFCYATRVLKWIVKLPADGFPQALVRRRMEIEENDLAVSLDLLFEIYLPQVGNLKAMMKKKFILHLILSTM